MVSMQCSIPHRIVISAVCAPRINVCPTPRHRLGCKAIAAIPHHTSIVLPVRSTLRSVSSLSGQLKRDAGVDVVPEDLSKSKSWSRRSVLVSSSSPAASSGDGVVPATGSKLDAFAEKLTTLFPVWVSSNLKTSLAFFCMM
jgi:hypothetical protein